MKTYFFFFEKTGNVGRASCVRNVALLNGKTEGDFERYGEWGGGLHGRRRVGGRWWSSWLLLILEIFDKL